VIAELLAAELASVIGVASGEEIDRTRKLATMGVDSLLAVDLRNRLEASLGKKLPASLLFDHPTIEDLALHLSRELDKDMAPVAPEPAAPEPADDELARRLEEQLARMSG
jgi:acyl carrier protein